MTVKIVMDDGRVHILENVTHIWNPSVKGNSMNGMDLFSHGVVQIDYQHGEMQTLIRASEIHSFTLSTD